MDGSYLDGKKILSIDQLATIIFCRVNKGLWFWHIWKIFHEFDLLPGAVWSVTFFQNTWNLFFMLTFDKITYMYLFR